METPLFRYWEERRSRRTSKIGSSWNGGWVYCSSWGRTHQIVFHGLSQLLEFRLGSSELLIQLRAITRFPCKFFSWHPNLDILFIGLSPRFPIFAYKFRGTHGSFERDGMTARSLPSIHWIPLLYLALHNPETCLRSPLPARKPSECSASNPAEHETRLPCILSLHIWSWFNSIFAIQSWIFISEKKFKSFFDLVHNDFHRDQSTFHHWNAPFQISPVAYRSTHWWRDMSYSRTRGSAGYMIWKLLL